MKTKIHVLFLLVFILFQSCKAQQDQAFPKVENHFKGVLDYRHEALEIVQRQQNGKEIKLGKINTDGTIYFNLPEFDIKALYDSIPLQPYKFQNIFSMNSSCKDRDVFAKTPFDAIYAQKYKLLIKKYGINVAILEPVGDSLVANSKYFWFYIDRAITFKDDCIKTSPTTNNPYANISANIKFEKGWNFIEERLEIVENNSEVDSLPYQTSTIHFSKIEPANKKVKWSLRQIQKDRKIEVAKKLYNLTPITKTKFEKWVPNKLGDLSITTKVHGKPPIGQSNKNNMHLVYTNKVEKREIDIYVVDCAKNPDDIGMIDFAYAMENKGKDEKDIKPYIAQYSEEKKATQLLYKVEDRIIVNASGVNINAEELWDYIKKLNVEKLLKE
ncbi:hypothetical protein [Lacinutrix sp. Bg11-31]|uniref:hypothetical protein n=1 Tax=Lacinutrix sp. Bg11-31 TaxID=2057808 RepID=UPI000C30C370|nr:hypothetical protein [Lacinutrix sp. Bg11-31]AUC80912.1 hypothetical protein CW733_01700 [Lacinutrix sp. Bg11-31]